jgi:hypothetical protein
LELRAIVTSSFKTSALLARVLDINTKIVTDRFKIEFTISFYWYLRRRIGFCANKVALFALVSIAIAHRIIAFFTPSLISIFPCSVNCLCLKESVEVVKDFLCSDRL